MNDEELTLDIAEPQILLHFDQDPNGLTEHHRILLCKLGPGKWVVLTPDHDLETVDLTQRRHTVLGRRARFPAALYDQVYCFDPLTRNELESFKRRAKTMGVILGDQEMEDVEAMVWVYSDPGSDRLGTPVAQEALAHAATMGVPRFG